jgi:hypothetical protein
MAITLPSNAQSAGIPSQWDDTISAPLASFLSGHEPAILTVDLIVAASQNIPALTPVGFDGSGRLVPAVSGTTQAIGITVAAIVTDASTTYKGAPVYRAGCFNPDRINWPASYDTEAEKFAAFNGAPTPTSIVIRRPKSGSV